MQETWVQSLCQKDPLEKGMATHSSILGWRIPWTEEPGGLQSMGSQRVGHTWATNTRASSITRGEQGLWGVAGFLWGVHCLSGGLTSCSDLKMKAMGPWGVSDASVSSEPQWVWGVSPALKFPLEAQKQNCRLVWSWRPVWVLSGTCSVWQWTWGVHLAIIRGPHPLPSEGVSYVGPAPTAVQWHYCLWPWLTHV